MAELKDTVTEMLSSDYKERFKAEYKQAVIRLTKLTKTIDDYYRKVLSFELDCPIELLERQQDILISYVDILVNRAGYEGINLDE